MSGLRRPEEFGNVERAENTYTDPRTGEHKSGTFLQGSHTGQPPIPVKGETFMPEERIPDGRTQSQQLSHKLDELSREFYLFSLATVYYTIRAKATFDLIYQFGAYLKVPALKNVVTYRSPSLIFEGLGDWNFVLQGIPREYGELFRLFVEQAVFPDYTVTPHQYWRVRRHSVPMFTPGELSAAAEVDLFVPTGIDCQFVPVRRPNGVYGFTRVAPDKGIVQEAYRFFEKTGG